MIGFLNIYKPLGITSFEAVRKLKRRVKPYKIGHLGTLDPMAEGILPIAIGNGTRLIEYIPDNTKTYLAVMQLGGVSDTQDQWGTITPVSSSSYSPERIETVFTQFRGEIEQIPPMYSAVHHKGQRLYELARQGITVERNSRTVIIHQLELVEISNAEPQQITFRVKCSSGTYIRTLCHDIGQALGTGGYMVSLVRESWGTFSLENAVSLAAAEEAWEQHLLDPLEVLKDLPRWMIPDQGTALKIASGNCICLPEDFPDGEVVLLLEGNNQIAAVAGRILKNETQWMIQPFKVLK